MPIAQGAGSPPRILRMANDRAPNWKQPQGFPPELPSIVFATVLMGHYRAIVSERLRQGPKMVSSAGFAASLYLREGIG
jgi:hypothetical protein